MDSSMQRIIITVFACCGSLAISLAQCLTDFSKLEPEPSVGFASGFGEAISMYDTYLAIGTTYSDTLGRAIKHGRSYISR